jgi:MoxR-like ATPase
MSQDSAAVSDAEAPPDAEAKPFEDGDVEAIAYFKEAYTMLRHQLGKVIVGQDKVIDELLIAIFTRSHALLVGVPGLAKTLLISTLAQTMNLSFQAHSIHPRSDAERYHRH